MAAHRPFAAALSIGLDARRRLAPGGGDEQSFAVWARAYTIAGNGTTPDAPPHGAVCRAGRAGAPRIQANTDYTVAPAARATPRSRQGTCTSISTARSGAINTTGLQLTATQLTNDLRRIHRTAHRATHTIRAICCCASTPTARRSERSVLRRLHRDFPTAQAGTLRWCAPARVEDPESYDGIDGLSASPENNGQAIRAAFKLRERLYFVKRAFAHVTQDDGTNEPSLWAIAEVSRKVGTPSVRGVGIGEDWVVIAHRTGLYIFNGGEPSKFLRRFNRPGTRSNWQHGHTLWVTVDTKERRILIASRLAPPLRPNKILMLDYRDLDDAEGLSPAVRPSTLPTLPQNRRGQNAQMDAVDDCCQRLTLSSSAATARPQLF